MRSITYVLLLAVACLLVNACRKPDFPPHSKVCQLIRLETGYTESDYSRIFTYGYNNQHLMDSVTGRPNFSPNLALSLHFDYNAQSLPVLATDYLYGINSKFIYQNGQIVRIEQPGIDHLYHLKYTYAYDFYGRIIRRISDTDTLWWEYKGTSRNFSKRLQHYIGAPANSLTFIEYKYDNKLNPMQTWPNLPLNPFSYELWEFESHEYEPIPENNPIYQGFTGDNGDGIPFVYMEVFYTYEYDDIYPLKANIRQVQHASTPEWITLIKTTYTYDCKNNNGHQ